MLVEVGRLMEWFFEVYWINRGVSMCLQARTASRTWVRCCNARACRRCGRQSVERVVRGLNATMLEQVVVVVGSPYSESYVGWMLHCWSMSWSKLVLGAWSSRVERVW